MAGSELQNGARPVRKLRKAAHVRALMDTKETNTSDPLAKVGAKCDFSSYSMCFHLFGVFFKRSEVNIE